LMREVGTDSDPGIAAQSERHGEAAANASR